VEIFTQKNFSEVGVLGTTVYYVLEDMKEEGIPTDGKLKATQISSMEEWKVGWV
jgi:hypothetical protein